MHLAAIWYLLYQLYRADGDSLGRTYQDIGAWICCRSVWPPGPRDKETHGSAYAYTKKVCYVTGGMLVAWARKELAKAGSHRRVGTNSPRERSGPADESWLRTSADPKACLRLEWLKLSVCAAVEAPLSLTQRESSRQVCRAEDFNRNVSLRQMMNANGSSYKASSERAKAVKTVVYFQQRNCHADCYHSHTRLAHLSNHGMPIAHGHAIVKMIVSAFLAIGTNI